MHPSKTPILYVLHMLIVLAVTIAVLLVTSNALALMGLVLMPQPPLVDPDEKQEKSQVMGFLSNDPERESD